MVALCFVNPLNAQPIENGLFVMYQGSAEVARESYGFDGTTLSDTVNIPSRGIRMESVARYGQDYSPESYHLNVYSGSADVPVQRIEIAFSDTAAVWTTSTQMGDSTGVSPLEGEYGFLQNLVFAQLAVVLLRYDHSTGGDQTLRVWVPETGALVDMSISFTSGTEGSAEVNGVVMNYEVNSDGWLTRLSVPSQNVTVESSDS